MDIGSCSLELSLDNPVHQSLQIQACLIPINFNIRLASSSSAFLCLHPTCLTIPPDSIPSPPYHQKGHGGRDLDSTLVTYLYESKDSAGKA